MKKLFVMMVLAAVAGSASAQLTPTTTYTGSGALIDVVYNNTAGTIGSIDSTNSNSWSSGLPSDSNPGLFTGGTAELSTASAFRVWYGVAVRQTGGTLSQADHTMRGGAQDGLGGVSSFHSTLEIDDTANTGSFNNLAISGQFTMWNQNGAAGATGNTLSLLNGYADVGVLAATSPNDEFVNILNGHLNVGYFSNARVAINMLDGGTGQFILDDMGGTAEAKSQLTNMRLNFETGSEASFTILQNASNVANNAQGAWESQVTNGYVTIDGTTVTGLGSFVIEDVGATGTKISLDFEAPTPNPATFSSAPSADSTRISMTATTGTDSNTVWYYFAETTGGNGATDSGWQTSPSYTDTRLDEFTEYTYTVQMRDSATTPNVGTASAPASATTGELVNYFDGSNSVLEIVYTFNNPDRGAIVSGNTNDWTGGLPTNGNPGLVVGGTHDFTSGDFMHGISIRQTGGQLTDATLAMRGGAYDGSTTHCDVEIDDASNTGFAYTNLAVSGLFTMWRSTLSASPANRLSVLNGYVTLGSLSAVNSTTDNQINIGSGKLDIASLTEVDVQVNMLSGGDGQIVVGDVNGDNLNAMKLDFASDSTASFTLNEDGGGSTVGYWQALVAASRVSINGTTATDLGLFTIETNGLSTTISLDPIFATEDNVFIAGSGSLLEIAYDNPPNRGNILSGNTNDWTGGLPINGNPGLVTGGNLDFTSGGFMHGISLRLQGGQYTDTGLAMRGGAADGSTTHCDVEIDDASNTGFAYTNLAITGALTMWNSLNSASNANTLSVLNGYVTAGSLSVVNLPKDHTINIGSGKLEIGSLTKINAQVNMLAGGDGEIVVDDQNGVDLVAGLMELDFASDSTASFTIMQNSSNLVDHSAGGTWEALIAANRVSIGGVVDTNSFSYYITSTDGTNTTIETYAGIAFPAPAQGPSVGPNLIPNGEFDQIVDIVDDGSLHGSGWYNITNSFGTFDIFDGEYARAENWEYSAVDPSNLTSYVETVLTNEFYMDALVNTNDNYVNGQITLNSCSDFNHFMTQSNALSAATIDAGGTYRLTVDAVQGPAASYDNDSGTFTVALTDGVGTPIVGGVLSDTVSDWTGVRTVDVSGDLLDDGSVNVVFDMIATNAIPGFPASAPHTDGSLVAKINLNEISLVEVFVYSIYDVNRDGVVDQVDVDLANSYLDGSVDGGDDAATRQALLTGGGLTDAQALFALNLTAFDVNGDDIFDAADVALIENPPVALDISITSGEVDGSGDFVVTVDVSTLGAGTTLYLRRSEDLVTGPITNIVDSAETVGSTLVLTDTNAPAGPAFYNVTDD